MSQSVSLHVARNIRQLRDARGLTQQRLAELSGVPRATWAHLESGGANPTLGVLVKVSEALQVSLDELVGPPRAAGRVWRLDELKTTRRAGCSVRRVVPDAISNLEVDRFAIPVGKRITGVPHTPGTREYLACEAGRIEVRAGGQIWEVGEGDVVSFRGDQKHSYANVGDIDAVAYSVVAIAPGAG